MDFKEWLKENGEFFWEMVDLAKVDVSGVNLEPMGTFDEDQAREDCESSVDDWFDSSDYFSDVYEDPDDDPEFYGVSVEDWEDENPAPDRDDYETLEEYQDAKDSWESERDDAESKYDGAVEVWNRKMRIERERAEERADEAKIEAIDECVEEKRNDSDGDSYGYKYKFSVDRKNFTVTMTEDMYYMGRYDIDKVYDILFEGPRGVSTTGMSGMAASKVYGEMLKAIKKLTLVEDVKGFHFSPAEPAMMIMYERFYQQFMKPKYIRVEAYTYIRSDIIKKAKEYSSDSAKSGIIDRMTTAHREQQQALKNVAALKEEGRSFVRRKENIVGRFVPSFAGFPVFVWDFDNTGKAIISRNPEDGPAGSNRVNPLGSLAVSAVAMPKIGSQEEMNSYVSSLKYDKDDFPAIDAITKAHYISFPNNQAFPERVKTMVEKIRERLSNELHLNDFVRASSMYPVALNRLLELAGLSSDSLKAGKPEVPVSMAPAPAVPSSTPNPKENP